ncbi:GNAT family N-acetyltransferase [Gottfriedia acidiceleris]|uniref:GNAT family N-acetyltransferase n=1 Tax=Bacillaceae TaxID=186817 RepID=UPI000BED10CB|nr:MULTISPECIES: GNAT family N-acetyltransferase [unclassified Bacillus (in: firmicutes)]PEC51546.1 GNAT family N-acetyltransferase [Bacillus sp. AFS096315]PFM78658.1 GNAT family N-acetyltransferase [Bacillus sp. AFS077874]
MEVVRAKSEHITEVANLFDQYRMFYKQESNLNGAIDFITERINNKDSVIFLVKEEEQYMGFTQLYPSFSSVSMKKLWILNDLYVTESARQKGVAQLLLNAAKKFAIESKAKALDLQTAIDNKSAQALYEKNGYQVDKEFLSYSLNLENLK